MSDKNVKNNYGIDLNSDKNVRVSTKKETRKVSTRSDVKPNIKNTKQSLISGKAKSVSKRPLKPMSAGKGLKKVSYFAGSYVRVIHLGGLCEIGKNMICIETTKDILIIDCGMGFPDSEMLGIDIVIPDYSYIEKNIEKVRGLVITHGHEDHIGGVPFFLKKFNVPIYGTRLSIGLIEEKLKEHNLLKTAKLNICSAGQILKFGSILVEMINVNHSIPDSVGLCITTPAGVIVHTGDFKIDYTPIDGQVIDLARFCEIGKRGVLLLMADSTNAERPGNTMSEKNIGESFGKLFLEAGSKRIIIASFSSNIHRIQQIINNAMKYGRHVAISGRSMETIVSKAIELGYLTVPDGLIISMDSLVKYPKEKIIIITTGSQGEQMSALSRMANKTHKNVVIDGEDFVIISASPIPGNEKFVNNVINNLMKLGARVIYENSYEIHTSGHACQDDLKTIISIVKPKYYMPVHGEYKHLKANGELAFSLGIAQKNIIIGDIGRVFEISSKGLTSKDVVASGSVFVDGLGVGDVGAVVLRDRKILSQDGIIIVAFVANSFSKEILAGPNLITRGFVYVKESEELLGEIKLCLRKIFNKMLEKNIKDFSVFKTKIKEELSNFIFKKTKRNPMILPIVVEV